MADTKKKLETKAKKLAKQEYIIWLTTVDSTNTPQPRPVWFIWDGTAIIVYSLNDGAKLRHIQANDQVAPSSGLTRTVRSPLSQVRRSRPVSPAL